MKTIHRDTQTIRAIASVDTTAYTAGQRVSFYKKCEGWTCLNHETGKYFHATSSIIRQTVRITQQF